MEQLTLCLDKVSVRYTFRPYVEIIAITFRSYPKVGLDGQCFVCATLLRSTKKATTLSQMLALNYVP